MADRLTRYRAKRDFGRTPEPAGGAPGGAMRFVVHKHHATADHYDLRLELGGVLKSWAVPKGPSLNPDDKRFAVETEDHPVEYLEFEGVIPAGEYGGGPMIVWDTGTWAPMGDAEADIAKGAFKFRLAGQKLSGGWMLARLKPKKGEAKTGWLFFKEHDGAARTDGDVLDDRPESVKSGLTIEALAASAAPAAPARAPTLRPGRLPGVVKAALPATFSPQLAETGPPPEGDGWLHEIKLDGYRTLAFVEAGQVRLITRGGLDWTVRYGDLPDAVAALPCKAALIDGEIAVPDDTGQTQFALLQQALSDKAGHWMVFYAFDLIHLNGWDLSAVPLERRKALLKDLLTGAGPALHYSDHVEGNGPGFFERVSEMGLEGIISKRRDAPYRPGRQASWIKTKAVLTGEFAICGYTVSKAAGGLAALAVAEEAEGEWTYRGKVGTGFDRATAEGLLQRLEPMRDDALVLPGAPKEVFPVRPLLTARVHYTSLTRDGSLRHPVFKGLREVALGAATAAPRKRLITDADLASIWVTNPTRRLFGRSGATKLDVAVYYAAVGDAMLPHLFGRPVSLVRCPSGRPQDCFFQRHAFTGMPPSVGVFETRNSDEEDRTYLYIRDVRGYLALAQFGVIEFHSWGTEYDRLERPDRVTFDLDPGEGVPWRETVDAAVHIRGELQALGLTAFVKTTGGKGLHLVVPLKPKADWPRIHATTGRIAERLAAGAPGVFVTTMAKDKRTRRIFIDFHRNARGATAVAPYSLRARTNLPVSTPVSWADLENIDAPGDLNYSTVPGLVAGSDDPWAALEAAAADLPKGI
ncbi:DNA ligase D [Wenxinia marina]|uniref:DNA ligase (ATP) n=1 Tax=Wenxinia marina DSM 24838 TaxID=1123501 RepID=A0A0D0Q6E4_9RHOB|nr:DNA ligase D [Wenxinia marina]KIQ70034.1 ATP-dependent DNA ligase LigD phosphoesterase module/ATP-dependent DNA ligase LigD polymerase module [Wenxinia marina DSM 24838]GGL62994.1 ATP-dependent DNA ligase [Wenxinia marina]